MFIVNSQSDLKIAFGPPVSETLKFVVVYQRLTSIFRMSCIFGISTWLQWVNLAFAAFNPLTPKI